MDKNDEEQMGIRNTYNRKKSKKKRWITNWWSNRG